MSFLLLGERGKTKFLSFSLRERGKAKFLPFSLGERGKAKLFFPSPLGRRWPRDEVG